jgi:transcriptional regulator with XRE-family HTH domain
MASKHPLQTYRESFDPQMKRAELARLLDVARTTVKRWEARERQIDPDLLERVSEKTGIPVAKLRPDLAKLLEVAR